MVIKFITVINSVEVHKGQKPVRSVVNYYKTHPQTPNISSDYKVQADIKLYKDYRQNQCFKILLINLQINIQEAIFKSITAIYCY